MKFEIGSGGKKILHTGPEKIKCVKCSQILETDIFLNENTNKLYCEQCMLKVNTPRIHGVTEEQFYKIDEVKIDG